MRVRAVSDAMPMVVRNTIYDQQHVSQTARIFQPSHTADFILNRSFRYSARPGVGLKAAPKYLK